MSCSPRVDGDFPHLYDWKVVNDAGWKSDFVVLAHGASLCGTQTSRRARVPSRPDPTAGTREDARSGEGIQWKQVAAAPRLRRG